MINLSGQAAGPLYRQVAEQLRERIDRGDLHSHDRLASEAEFSRVQGISHVTYRRALKVLEDAGYIYKVHGSGSFVSERRRRHHLPTDLANRRYVIFSFPEYSEDSPMAATITAAVEWLYGHDHSVVRVGFLDGEDERRHLLRNERIMCGIIASADSRSSERVARNLQEYRERGYPVVLTGSVAGDPEFDQVRADDQGGAASAVRHFAANGHTEIGLVSARAPGESCGHRRLGYESAMAELGLATRIYYTGGTRSPHQTEAAYELTKRELAGGDRPTAILCENDVSAYGVYQAFVELGVKVPEEVELCGFDNTAGNAPFALDYHQSQVSTVDVPRAEVGRRAAALLDKRLRGWDAPLQRILLPANLLHRETTRAGSPVLEKTP